MNHPETYNDFIKLIENNDPSVAATMLSQDYIHVDELNELEEQWREFAEDNFEWNEYNEGMHTGILSCADDISELR